MTKIVKESIDEYQLLDVIKSCEEHYKNALIKGDEELADVYKDMIIDLKTKI